MIGTCIILSELLLPRSSREPLPERVKGETTRKGGLLMKQPGNRATHLPQPCVHHWLCGDQRSTIVHAVCKKCGAEADFEQHWYPQGLVKKNQAKADVAARETVTASS